MDTSNKSKEGAAAGKRKVDQETGTLVAMGFTALQAQEALELNNGNVDDAIKSLLSKQRRSEVDARDESMPVADAGKGDIHPRASGNATNTIPRDASGNQGRLVHVYPGAEAVAGPEYDPTATDDYTLTSPPSKVKSTVPLEARLVYGIEDGVEALRKELAHVEALREELARIRNAPVAQVIPDVEAPMGMGADTSFSNDASSGNLESFIRSTVCGTRKKRVILVGILAFVVFVIILVAAS